jgi:hypothetical protein
VRGPPGFPVLPEEDEIARGAARRPALERGLGLVREHDVADLALAEPDRQCPAVEVEVGTLEAGKLRVSAAG